MSVTFQIKGFPQRERRWREIGQVVQGLRGEVVSTPSRAGGGGITNPELIRLHASGGKHLPARSILHITQQNRDSFLKDLLTTVTTLMKDVGGNIRSGLMGVFQRHAQAMAQNIAGNIDSQSHVPWAGDGVLATGTGGQFAPLSPGYAKQKTRKGKGGKILRSTGQMQASIKGQVKEGG